MSKAINIRVIPNAGKNEVSDEDGTIRVRVTTPATRGKANKAAIKLLAKFLNVKTSSIKIIKGEKSRDKVIQMDILRT